MRQKLKSMQSSAETTSKKRTQEETTGCSTLQTTDNDTCTPTAKWKSMNYCNIDLSNDEVGDMEKLEQTVQEDHPNRKYIKRTMKTTNRARRKWIQ